MSRIPETARINKYIEERDIAGLRVFLSEIQRDGRADNDICLLLALTGVDELEKRHGKEGLFFRYREMDRLLSDHRELRRMVRKAEWQEEYPLKEALEASEKRGVSAYELGWTVNACCVKREIVWRRLQNAGKE